MVDGSRRLLVVRNLVVFFGAEQDGEDNTPSAALDAIRPDVIFKGGDYTIDQLPEAQVVLAYGGEVDIMPLYEGHSTTNTINKMKQTGWFYHLITLASTPNAFQGELTLYFLQESW